MAATYGQVDHSTTPAKNPFAVPVGNGPSARNGRNIDAKYIDVNLLVQVSTDDNYIQSMPTDIIFVLDTQTNAAQCTFTDVFNVVGMNPMINLENVDRFQVLKWKRIVLVPTGYAVTVGPNNKMTWTAYRKKFRIPLNIPVNYKAGGTTEQISTIADNSFHIFAFSGNGAAGLVTEINVDMRLRYLD